MLFGEHERESGKQQALRETEALQAARQTRWSAWLAVALFLIAVGVALVSVLWPLPLGALAAALAIGALCAGVSGSTIRALTDLLEVKSSEYSRRPQIRSALGIVAGVFTALLIALPQVTGESHLPPQAAARITDADKLAMKAERLGAAMPTALFAAFVAAFAIYQFYRRLREIQVPGPALPGKESK
jgi:hypothetical protein